MKSGSNQLSIGTLAQAVDVTVETIRFYQRKGLLREPERPRGSIRQYGQSDIERLGFIKTAQRLGFDLEEISELLRLEGSPGCEEAQFLAEQKLTDVRRKIKTLREIEESLEILVEQCQVSRGGVTCPLTAALYGRLVDIQYPAAGF
ncbi:MerR family transcriptional regulator [Marinobacter sp.]|uniref:MerR family transcriptional regulator n=1 Tax=Marinobacter sp. TaxID=50741 RepID=UPI00384B2E1F